MPRSYTAHDFIQLPLLDANETIVVGKAIGAVAAKLGHLPGSVADVLAELGTTTDALATEMKKNVTATDDPAAQRDADHAVDSAWSAFEHWLGGFTRLPADAGAEVAIAHRVYDRLFPNGLRFLTLRFRSEWAESERRLAIMREEKLDAEVAKLGGRAFLAELERAHAAYGAALHVTDPAPAPAEPRSVKITRMAAQNTLRTLIAEIASASVRRHAPLAKDAADKLLAPITTWKPAAHAAAPAPAPGTADAPA